MTVAARPVPGRYAGRLGGLLVLLVSFRREGWHGYFANRMRRYGSTVFKVNLFQPTIAILDRPGLESLFAAPHLVQDYGFSWAAPPRPLVGDVTPSLFETGPAHDVPKAIYLDLLRALAPSLDAHVDRALAPYLLRWQGPGVHHWADDLEDFSAALLYRWMLGIQPSPADVRTLYLNLFNHPFRALTRWFKGSLYSRSLVISRDLFAAIGSAEDFKTVVALAKSHGFDDKPMLVRQIAFIVGMNAFLGIQSLLKSLLGELSLRPEHCGDLRDALRGKDTAGILRDPHLDRFVRETLRLHSPVSFIFGRATGSSTIQSVSGVFEIAAGELLMGVMPFAMIDTLAAPDAEQFRPARHADPAAAAQLVWPRGLHDASVGPRDRTCAGKDIAVMIAKLVAARILVHHAWEFAEPIRWSKGAHTMNVAAPQGPMTLRWFARVA